MALNFKRRGDTFEFTATAAIASGELVKFGDVIGVAQNDAAIGETAVLGLGGVYELPKFSTGAIAAGVKVYRRTADGEVQASATAADLIGVADEAAADGATLIKVRLNGTFT